MGGGKGAPSTPAYNPAEGQAYLQRYPDVAQEGMDPYTHYQRHGQGEGRYWGMGQQGGLSYPGLIFPTDTGFFGGDWGMSGGGGGGGGSDMPSYEQQMADQQARLEAQEAERRRIEGENQRDALYANYLDAAGTATDYINKEIADEVANAQLLGIDYSITDEQKSTRISDYFATVWGEGQQQQLEALMGEWGNPKGFTDWTVTRGDASVYGEEQGAEETVGAGRGQKPRGVLEEDEEALLGGATAILGGE